jgi:transcription initiation factor TFIIIB Brf1 subunit/transcription initiation factor TFIIB
MSDPDLPTNAATKTEAIDLIREGGKRLELSDSVVNNAEQLFEARHADTSDYTPVTFDTMVAASIYAAVKIEQVGVPVGAVCDVLGTEQKAVFRELKRIEKTVDVPIPIETPAMFVPRIVERLSSAEGVVDTDIERTKTVATTIAEELTESGYANGCSRSGVAGGVVYALSRIAPWNESTPTQQQVASAAEVSAVTIRDHYQDILETISIEDYIDDVEPDGGHQKEVGSQL